MSKMVGRKPPEAALVSRLWRVSGTNVDVAVAHEMLLALGQATTQSPLKIELDPAERRPEPMPAPPAIHEGFDAIKIVETALSVAAIRGAELSMVNGALRQDGASAHLALLRILVKVERIPCMSEDCDGIEDGEPATKHRPNPTRCHRCAAVRLARSVVNE